MNYSKEEERLLEDLYQKGYSIKQIVDILNDKIWKGEKVRTIAALERKISRLGLNARKYSRYNTLEISAQKRKIIKLRKAGKSYREIATILNIPVGTVKSVLSFLRNRTIVGDIVNFEQKALTDHDYVKLHSVEELQKRCETLTQELAKAKAISNIIVDTIKQNMVYLKPVVKVPEIRIKKKYKPEIAILEFSDVHIGSVVKPSETSGISEYNFKIFQHRLKVLLNGLAEIIDIERRGRNIDILHIHMLGDIVDNENIYKGQGRHIDKSAVDQLFEGGSEICNNLLLPLLKIFKKVRVYCVWGNHGRFGSPGEYDTRTNLDYILYRFLAERLRLDKSIEFYISDGSKLLYEIPEAPNYRHLLSHGYTINSWMGVPYYGVDRYHARNVQLYGLNIHYLHLAHFHTASSIDIRYGEKIINGSFIGGSELSTERLQLASQPKQIIFGFNNRWGKTWEYSLFLEEVKPLEADKKGIYTPYHKEVLK